jgi:multidrug efflux pump
MSLASTAIHRPVLSTVFSLVIVMLGVMGYQQLGVREYPSVDPPIISVDTTYPGASAELIEAQITEPLEQSVNGVAGIRSLTSTSREGRSSIRVEFEISIDLDSAANDVRDRVARAQRDLPPDADPPTVAKADADRNPVVMVTLRSSSRELIELSDIADRVFKPRFETIPGVSEVDIWGERRYAMRLTLDPNRLSAAGLTPEDVRAALDRENVELPGGRLEGASIEIPVRTLTRLKTEEEFNDMVLLDQGGKFVRLRDVGQARVGAENERQIVKENGIPGVGIVLRPQPGSNQIAIADEFYRRLALAKADLPQDVEVVEGFDSTIFVRGAIHEVMKTLIEATVLVVLIIFLFLRDFRSTIIPVLAIPVSLIGTFFLLYLAGFSINVLTLLGLVLAIGIVVDDAIVVLENIYTKLEEGMPPEQAGIEGMREIFVAVVATTLALVAVFMPILFLGGFTGKLFREFGVTMAGSIAISAVVALTLTPMLCTRMLRAHKPTRIHRWTEPLFNWMNNLYASTLRGFLRVRWLAFPILAAAGFACWWAYQRLPSELAPLEDRGLMRVTARAPEGASFEYMAGTMDELVDLMRKEMPEATSLWAFTAPNFGAGSNNGFVRVALKDAGERGRTQQEIAAALQRATRNFGNARVFVSQEQSLSPSTGGGGSQLPVQFVLQAPNLQRLREELPKFMEQAEASASFSRVDVDLEFNKTQLEVEILRDRARTLGVPVSAIAQTLALALGEQRLGYFLRDGRQYFVIAELYREDRDVTSSLNQLTVPAADGTPIRLDNLVTYSERTNPPRLLRFNRYVSATVSAEPADGISLGQGIAEMQRIAKEVLGEDIRTDLAGVSRDFRDGSSSLGFVFLFALALVFLVLAGQFESFRDPFIILLTVPLALTGALLAMVWADQTMNVFSQIGIIMLIGLVTKNGILIVEFANQRKATGLNRVQAVTEAAIARFRPVLMTALATMLGIAPLAFAHGTGAESRSSLGVNVLGGMALSTFLTLFVVPAVYTYLSSKTARHGMKEEAEADPAPKPEPVAAH